ncbi:MAG: signal peptidase I [Planctomycetota bacterium JB042]
MSQTAEPRKPKKAAPPEPTAAQRAAAPRYLLGGAVFGAVLIGFLHLVLDDESKGTVLWHYGRYLGIGLSAWCGWSIGLGRGRAVAENVECLAIAVVMALILKHFLIEAYKIPTGSMQPTILGNDEQGIFDRVLVNKFSYLIDEPERYDVIVFKYPLDRSKNYIKRLLGLPGEHVMITHGDVFTAHDGPDGRRTPWRVARKPDGVRDSVLKTIYPSGRDGERFDDRFQVVHGSHDVDGDEVVLSADTRIRYGRGEPIRDRYLDGYDPDWGIGTPFHVPEGGAETVSDLSLAAAVTPAEGTREIVLSVFADNIERRAVLPVGDGPTRLEMGYRDASGDALVAVTDAFPVRVAEVDRAFLKADRATDVAFFHVDQELVLEVDGDRVLSFAYEVDHDGDASGGDGDGPRYPPLRGSTNEVAFETRGGGAAIEELEVRRDIHYLAMNGSRQQTFSVPDDALLVLGDNTQNSSDGRMWRAQRVELPDGRETYRERGDVHDRSKRDFVDVYGERYRTRNGPAPVVYSTDTQAFSFVPRNLLLGKAIAVFWPIYPHFRWKLIR